MSNSELIMHIHIPKTGGTTLRSQVLARAIPKNQLLWLQHYPKAGHRVPSVAKIASQLKFRSNNSIKVVAGHFGYNMWFPHLEQQILSQLKLQRPVSQITMLRNPVDRVISAYYFDEMMHSKFGSGSFPSLQKYVENKQGANIQTLWLGGGHLDLDVAKENLESLRAFGILEHFEESVRLMSLIFKWQIAKYRKENVNKARPGIKSIEESILSKIQENNHLDVQLYEHAVKLFKKRCSVLDSKTVLVRDKSRFLAGINRAQSPRRNRRRFLTH